MAVYESPEPQQLVDVVPPSTTQEESDETSATGRKTRRSRRGGYRRKRQQQRKVADLMQESAARRSQVSKPTAAAAGNCDSSTATTEGESSSSESTHGDSSSPQRTVARKRNNHHRAQQQQPPQQVCYNPNPYMQHGHPQYQYPAMNYNAKQSTASAPYYNKKRGGKHGSKNANVSSLQRAMTKQQQQDMYVAMDCEMVGVGEYGAHSVLARVTLVDWNGNILMDELIKPQWEVTDYRTFVSGITKEMLDNAKMDFATCRNQVMRILHGRILVGHGLKNDLGVLGIAHPWYMIRDTAEYEPFMKMRPQIGVLCPRGLKDLCKEKLNRDVQVYGRPHCPKEDAVAALDLYKLVSNEFEQSMGYKWDMAVVAQHQQLRL